MRPLAASLIPGKNEVARKAVMHAAVTIFLKLNFILFRLLLIVASLRCFVIFVGLMLSWFVVFIVNEKKGESLTEICILCVRFCRDVIKKAH